jgi:glycolate oxidase FAD binding subunit
VAAGLGGPGRFRFGGLRDFIVGVRFVDGSGRLMRMGGKVVKNAAGFDLPKFFVGSLGRFGALAEVTFKVFPRAVTTRTLRLSAVDTAAMTTIFTEAAGQRWELDALEAWPAEGVVYARLAGPAAALDVLAAEIFSRWPGVALTDDEASSFWSGVREFAWAHDGGELVMVALVPMFG